MRGLHSVRERPFRSLLFSMLGSRLSDRYEILEELGRGGMGVVYRALDPVLKRDVAVKVIAPEMLTQQTEQRFEAEARLVAQMDHPSIVPIYDFGRNEGSLFFVMPVVQGKSLRDFIRAGELKLGAVVDIGISAADALEYSHSRGVIHRDIKPENLMVALDGDVRLRIMDFGLARGNNISSLTKTGMLMGTVAYISPEQVRGGAVDGRTDIYALGCVLYECAAGQVPFAGDMQSVLYRVVHELPQSLRELGANVEPELEDIILSCLAKEPAERPAEAGEFVRRLKAYRSRMRDSQKMLSVMSTQAIPAQRPALSPFVGREEELRTLQQRLNAALRGECHMVVIAGPAGAGKTRLLDELENLALAREVRVLHGRFVEQAGAFPYHGFCEAVQEFFSQRERSGGASAPPDLSDLADDLVALFPMLAEIPAIRSAAATDSAAPLSSPERSAENRAEIFELLARTLTRLSGGRPLLLLLEELHGADVSIEALQYIVRRLGPTPTLIVCSYRSEEVDRTHPVTSMVDAFRGDRKFALLELGPFTPQEHRDFLLTLTGGSPVVEHLAERLYEVSEGNPFFTKELVRSMIDAGSMTQDDTGAWSLAGSETISSDSLPATIQQAVETRIERLPEDLREILSVAAVMGRSFDFEDLEVLAGGNVDLDDAVDRFIQEGLLEEDRQARGDRFNFCSAIVREVLYGELGRRKRRRLHAKYAERLEKRQAGRLERVYPQLLFHFAEGDVADKTVEYGLLHARRSLESFSPEEVIRSARAALEFLDEDWEGDRLTEGEARMILAGGHRLAGDMPSALREVEAAIAVFEKHDRRDRAVEAILSAAKAAWQARQTEETRRWVERGIQLAEETKAVESLAQFLSLAATLANLRGDYVRGREYQRRAEALLKDSKETPDRTPIPEGGTVVAGLSARPTADTPVDMQLTEEFELFSNVCESLLATDESGNLISRLCEVWEARNEGRTFRFVLRKGVRFHDGTPLDAASAKRAIEEAVRGAASELPAGFSVISGAVEFASDGQAEIEGLRAHSADTLEIRLKEELPIYPALLSDPRTALFLRGPNGELLGSGPFRLARREADFLLLERNAEHWSGQPPRVDAVEFRTGLSASALAADFLSGSLDLTRDLAPDDLDAVLRDPRFHNSLVEAPQKFTYFVLFNTSSGPLVADPELRRILARSIRARDLVWQTLGRFAVPAVGLIPPGILGHDAGRRPQVLSPDEAREALKPFLSADGRLQLRAAIHPLIRDRYGDLLEGLLSAWRELGVEVEFATDDLQSYIEAWRQPSNLDLMIMRWQPDFDDPDSCTHILFHSRAGQLRGWFASPESDDMLDKARREARPTMREGLYRKFEAQLLEQNALVPLFHDIGYRLAGARLRGVVLGSVAPYVNYKSLGKAAGEAAAAPLRVVGGGVVQVPVSVPVNTLEPLLSIYLEEGEVLSPIYETLMRDVGGAQIEPWLAEEWRVEEDGRRYWFRLRDGVRFHDGRRLTARDVRFSLERVLQAPDCPGRGYYAPIRGARALIDGSEPHLEGVRILSAREFVIELESPVSFFPVLLSCSYASILPEGTRKIGGSIEEGAVGTGPFRVVSFEPGRRLELERNPYYWRPGLPRADRLIFSFGIEPSEILEGFRSGRFSMASELVPEIVESLRRDPKFARGYHEMPQLSCYYLVLNANRGPLKDAALRRRLAAALDVPRLVREVQGRQAVPARGLIPPGLLGHDAGAPLPHADAGGAPGDRIELTAVMGPVFAAEYAPFRLALQRELERAGIHLRWIDETGEGFNDAIRSASVDVLLGRWIADYPDADTFAHVLQSKDGILGRFCGSPEIDALIHAGRTEVDPAARHAIYRQIEQVIARDNLLVPLFHEQTYRFARPELEGVALSYWVPTVAYEQLRIRA